MKKTFFFFLFYQLTTHLNALSPLSLAMCANRLKAYQFMAVNDIQQLSDFLTYLCALICCGSHCCCCCDCCVGRACKRTGDECSPCRGRRSPKSGHRTRYQEKGFRAGNGQQLASREPDKRERVRRSAAGASSVRVRILERPTWRDLSHSDCQG